MTALALLFGVALDAEAQTVASPYRFVNKIRDLGPFVGYIFADPGQADLGPKPGPAFGVQGNVRLSDPINLGIYAGYFPSTRDVIDATGDDAPRVVGQEPINLVILAGRLHLQLTGSRSWNNLIPYIIGGMGIAFDTQGTIACPFGSTRPQCQIFPTERFNFGTSFVGQLGIGVAWAPRDKIGARLIVQDDIWRLKTPDGYYFTPDIKLNPIPPPTQWTNNIEISLIVSYWF
jgi:hypothetical protein